MPGGLPGLRELHQQHRSLSAGRAGRARPLGGGIGAEAHAGQKRNSGEPYIAHPLAAAPILADLRLDPETLFAAILHDVLEDTPTPRRGSREKFGDPVAEMVDGVTKLDKIQFKSRAEAEAESFRKMMLAMSATCA